MSALKNINVANINIRARPYGVLRSVLSANGQSAYDSAIAGNFFRVSADDYAAAASQLINISKIGMNDTQVAEFVGSPYTGVCASILNANLSIVVAGSYILGFQAWSTSSANNTGFTYLISNTHQGTYTALANKVTVTPTANSRSYYLRKDPPAQSANTFIGIVLDANSNFRFTSTSFANSAFDCTPPYTSPWTTRSSGMPNFQTLTTNIQQW